MEVSEKLGQHLPILQFACELSSIWIPDASIMCTTEHITLPVKSVPP